ncbi:MAG: glmZ(sRNA)-inactivating NTPase [Betaproteobacteria bacterium ADurb.Bin341]|nr:MAG: glmZ(sRNA)-inactivating NTPase [Betaproteobacteria bacterium ADurb.Bin341]
MDFILISGLSGSGKSVALNVLEDEDYYCVDNLPSSMLERLVEELQHSGYGKAAVAVDIRSGKSVERLPTEIERLKQSNPSLRLIFLDARDDTLIRRFSETRRRHPLSAPNRTLEQAISEERRRLEAIAALGHRIDTSDLKANALRQWIRQFAGAGSAREHLIIFQSFGFKHGIPLDADLVFDVRCLPNPHYESDLQALTGLDAPVATFLEAHDEVGQMRPGYPPISATDEACSTSRSAALAASTVQSIWWSGCVGNLAGKARCWCGTVHSRELLAQTDQTRRRAAGADSRHRLRTGLSHALAGRPG